MPARRPHSALKLTAFFTHFAAHAGLYRSPNRRNDLVIQHENWEHIGIMMQRANGRLSPEVLYPVTDCCDGPFSQPAVGDLNGDSRPDIAVTAGQRGVAALYQK